ncbi:MAG: hypothetical protein K0S39_4617 [Paenibacillus sp.]|jgi:preprotein translocase subunit YajC|nr:hypothetical protein [Paenibacillus sp.]
MLAVANYKKCKMYLNKHVKIVTASGTYYGKISKVDKKKVYLKVSAVKNGKSVHTSFLPFILPLVLFDLLVIVLLETKSKRRVY